MWSTLAVLWKSRLSSQAAHSINHSCKRPQVRILRTRCIHGDDCALPGRDLGVCVAASCSAELLGCCAVGARWFGAQSALASDFSVDSCQTVSLPGNRSAQVYNNTASAKCQVRHHPQLLHGMKALDVASLQAYKCSH